MVQQRSESGENVKAVDVSERSHNSSALIRHRPESAIVRGLSEIYWGAAPDTHMPFVRQEANDWYVDDVIWNMVVLDVRMHVYACAMYPYCYSRSSIVLACSSK